MNNRPFECKEISFTLADNPPGAHMQCGEKLADQEQYENYYKILQKYDSSNNISLKKDMNGVLTFTFGNKTGEEAVQLCRECLDYCKSLQDNLKRKAENPNTMELSKEEEVALIEKIDWGKVTAKATKDAVFLSYAGKNKISFSDIYTAFKLLIKAENRENQLHVDVEKTGNSSEFKIFSNDTTQKIIDLKNLCQGIINRQAKKKINGIPGISNMFLYQPQPSTQETQHVGQIREVFPNKRKRH